MLLFATLGFGMPFIVTQYAQQVLGYSALEFGVAFVVTPVAAAVGMIVAQAAVARVGFRPVAATGMALLGAGSLLLTQPSVGGSYFGDIFFGHPRLRPRHRPRLRHCHDRRPRGRRRARGGPRLGPQQNRLPARRGARRRHRLDGRCLALRGFPGGQRRCGPARRAHGGLPVCLCGLRRPRRDRRGAGAPAVGPAAEATPGTAGAGAGPDGG
jgi:hypothetical protein